MVPQPSKRHAIVKTVANQRIMRLNDRPTTTTANVVLSSLGAMATSTANEAHLFCTLYSFYVVARESVVSSSAANPMGAVFKNPHCAMCNGIPLNATSCITLAPEGTLKIRCGC